MSVINKKPFIKTLIESLSDSDLTTFRTMIDGGGSQTVLLRTTSNTYVNSERTRITNSDKGVHRCSLEVQGGLYTWNGYLLFNDDYCVLIYYSDSFQGLGWLKVLPGFQETQYIGEELSITELRSELDDTAESEKAEIISDVNDGIHAGAIEVPAYYETTNIAGLSDSFINKLKSGDIVIKKTGNLRHTYVVTYKEKNQGICLTYFAFGYLETVSYDYVGGHWVYNSTDVFYAESLVSSLIAPAYSASATYAVGDLVTVGLKLYKCTEAIADPEEFNSSKWTQTTLSEALSN